MRTDSLGEKLNVMISNLPTNGVSLAEIRDIVGQDGLLVLIAFLAIVFMVPVSIPGVSTVFGAAILMIGTSRLLGCNLWLPKCIAQRVLPTEKLRTGLNQSSLWLHRLERLSRPHRLNWLTSTWLAEILNNCALITASALLMAPFGLIPFSNTLPALALLFLSHWTLAARWSLHPVRTSCQPLCIYLLYRHPGRRQCSHPSGVLACYGKSVMNCVE